MGMGGDSDAKFMKISQIVNRMGKASTKVSTLQPIEFKSNNSRLNSYQP